MKQKEYTKKEIEAILEENKRLKVENDSMQKVLNSKRFRAAEKIANTYNAVVPEGTSRRKVVGIFMRPVKALVRYRAEWLTRKVEKCIGNNKKVIVMHSIPWNTPLRQRPHHLAKALTRDKKVVVVYLEPDEQLNKFRKISDRFLTVNSWEVVFKRNHDDTNRYYFFFNNVSNIDLVTLQKIRKAGYEIVYEYIDEFHEDISGSLMNQLKVWKKLPELKPVLVLASANKLYEEAVRHFGERIVLMSKNAVNVEDFDYKNFENVDAPSDMQKVIQNNKPIVGYYGALAPWLDYDLIADAARENPQFDFVLIGVNYQDALKRLDLSIPNIYYLGPKNYNELPKYSSHFNCAIIPFNEGEIAKGTSPVKLFEYMAMGLPTVGTKDLDECRGYEYVYLAQNRKDFSEKIVKAIDVHKKNSVREKLLKQAEDNSWEKRADDILARLK